MEVKSAHLLENLINSFSIEIGSLKQLMQIRTISPENASKNLSDFEEKITEIEYIT